MFIVFDWLAYHAFGDFVETSSFSERFNNKGYLYIKDENGFQRENLGPIIGRGGSKKAIQLERGRVLLVPNDDVESYCEERWQRIVDEEVEVSAVMKRIGLLTTEPKKVTLHLSRKNQDAMPAFVCASFDEINKANNFHILEYKWGKPSRKCSLFPNPNDRFKEEKWDEVVEELLVDISKIYRENIYVSPDALHLAIQPGKARYFGFDFSLKYSRYEPRKINVENTVKNLVTGLINHEFAIHKGYYDGLDGFFDRLEEKYTRKVVQLSS